MGIMLYFLLWVMQGLYHQPYYDDAYILLLPLPLLLLLLLLLRLPAATKCRQFRVDPRNASTIP